MIYNVVLVSGVQQSDSVTYIYVCVCVCVSASMFSRVRLFATMLNCRPARLLCPWNFPGKNTGVGCCFFLQGILPTGIKTASPWSPALAGRFFITESPGKPLDEEQV